MSAINGSRPAGGTGKEFDPVARQSSQATGSVLQFPRRDRQAPRPWTNDELAEFYRIAHILRASGLELETDAGLSDAGDPWFAYIHADSGDVVAHFARIDGLVHAVGLPSGRRFSGPDLKSIVAQLTQAQPLLRVVGGQGKPMLSFLPIVAITTFVAAGLLAARDAHAAAGDHAVGGTDHADGAHGGALGLLKAERGDGATPPIAEGSPVKATISLSGAVRLDPPSGVTSRSEARADPYARAASMVEQFAVLASALLVSGLVAAGASDASGANWWDALAAAPVAVEHAGIGADVALPPATSDAAPLAPISVHSAAVSAVDVVVTNATPSEPRSVVAATPDHAPAMDHSLSLAIGDGATGGFKPAPTVPQDTAATGPSTGSGAITPVLVASTNATQPTAHETAAKLEASQDLGGAVAVKVGPADGQFSLLSITLLRPETTPATIDAAHAKTTDAPHAPAEAPATKPAAAPAPTPEAAPAAPAAAVTPAPTVDPNAPLVLSLDGSDTTADLGRGLAYIYYQGGNVVLKNFVIGQDRVYIANPILDGLNPTAHTDAQHDLILDFGHHATLTLLGALPSTLLIA